MNQSPNTGETQYQDGFDAFFDGVKMGRCPYRANTFEWQVWRNGWLDGFRVAKEEDGTDYQSEYPGY